LTQSLKTLVAYGTKKGSTREVAEKVAERLLDRHRGELATLPVAVFGMGPMKMEPKEEADARKQVDANLKKVPEVDPVSVAIFGGVIDPAKLHFPFNKIPASDARDWDAIRMWAEALPAKLGQVGLARVSD
jgi:menaquinone-dependent protoporphyrinogen oxidase